MHILRKPCDNAGIKIISRFGFFRKNYMWSSNNIRMSFCQFSLSCSALCNLDGFTHSRGIPVTIETRSTFSLAFTFDFHLLCIAFFRYIHSHGMDVYPSTLLRDVLAGLSILPLLGIGYMVTVPVE